MEKMSLLKLTMGRDMCICIVFMTLIIEGIAQNGASSAVRVKKVEIFEVDEESNVDGPVYGFKSCGGPGKLLDHRVQGCAANSTCEVPTNTVTRLEVDFIPSESLSRVGMRVRIVHNGKFIRAFEEAIDDSEVEAGKRYRMVGYGLASNDFQGERILVYHIIYRLSDKTEEVCVRAEFDLY